jgi:hypothetical protein
MAQIRPPTGTLVSTASPTHSLSRSERDPRSETFLHPSQICDEEPLESMFPEPHEGTLSRPIETLKQTSRFGPHALIQDYEPMNGEWTPCDSDSEVP